MVFDMKTWRRVNIAKCREYRRRSSRKFRELHPELAKVKEKERYQRYKESIKTRSRKWRRDNPARALATKREYAKRNRLKVINLLGGKCTKCGFSDHRALQLDHINGHTEPCGSRLRSGDKLYAAILVGKRELKDFQILCANCNFIKMIELKEYLFRRNESGEIITRQLMPMR